MMNAYKAWVDYGEGSTVVFAETRRTAMKVCEECRFCDNTPASRPEGEEGDADVGRVLPPEYLYFRGDGEHNHFRTEYTGGQTWDWSLDSPYEEG